MESPRPPAGEPPPLHLPGSLADEASAGLASLPLGHTAQTDRPTSPRKSKEAKRSVFDSIGPKEIQNPKKGRGLKHAFTKVTSGNSRKGGERCCTRAWCRAGCVKWATRIADSTRFAVLTMSLTVYALFGDDLRLATTTKRMDIVFDIFTIMCICVFVVEVLATCVSKADYVGSFFFWLDVLPTGTLILDLTFVADALFCNNIDGGSALKSGRAGRAGARAGRTVRIIRLIRLVKVYKMYVSALEHREKEKEVQADARYAPGDMPPSPCGMDGSFGDAGTQSQWTWAGDDPEQSVAVDSAPVTASSVKQKAPKETRVGKKLSEMTTRRVIVLVLVMLFGLPQFLPGSHGYDELKASPSYGMEVVYAKWRKWCHFNSSHPKELPSCLRSDQILSSNGSRSFKQISSESAPSRYWFERYLLGFIHMHHAGDFAWTLHWLGMYSKTLRTTLISEGHSDVDAEIAFRLSKLGQLSQNIFLANFSLHPNDWDATFANDSWVQKMVTLPSKVKTRLTSPWREECSKFYGVAVTSGKVDDDTKCTLEEDLRCSEIAFYAPVGRSADEADAVQWLFAFDKRTTTKMEAGLSMLQTIFICFAVGIGALTFSNDANQLLLKPIERMMAKLETIKDNPMEAMRLGDAEFKRLQYESIERKDKIANANGLWKCWLHCKQKQKIQEPMETIILEKTIIKLGGLLALCFGEEGGEIIGSYIGDSLNDSSTTVDIMVAGHKVDALIGFCQIHKFAGFTQTLGEKVLLFVNQVSEIVHLTADEYSGAPNKNMGDSFLLAWRLDSRMEQDARMKVTDLGIMACVRIIAAVNKSPELAAYRDRDTTGFVMASRDFRVELGLGLHTGWAIEGAIGSDYKIDAAYLSPNVNMAARLQGATEHYGTCILMSDVVISQCTAEMALTCRLIDQVKTKRMDAPLRLYTVDLDADQLSVDKKPAIPPVKNRYKWRQMREMQKAQKWAAGFKVWDFFIMDFDIMKMRSPFTDEFLRRFFTAYRNYEAGEWMVARDLFFTCHFEPKYHTPPVDLREEDWPKDGPTRALLTFMQGHNFEAPPGWAGYRELAATQVSLAVPE